jgi:hypothetical protein
LSEAQYSNSGDKPEHISGLTAPNAQGEVYLKGQFYAFEL